MYEVVKHVIGTGRYALEDMLKKLDARWVQGALTDAQHSELVAAAQGGAKAENSVDILDKLRELEERVSKMEGGASADAEEYTAGKWYYSGNRVTFEGATYVCIAPEGAVCVWSPAEYPAYWRKEAQVNA